jgi:hypothetical protein
LDKHLKKDWIAALESGEFKQTKITLVNERGYCCLGVLCEIMPHTEKEYEYGGNYGIFTNTFDEDDYGYNLREEGLLRKETLDLTGISEDEQEKLIRMNDTGRSFKEIAQYIRKKL